MGFDVVEGVLGAGLPYLRFGSGPPLVMASGLSPDHTNPTGWWRRSAIAAAAGFADHFTVYLVNRKQGLAPGATMADIAADYAHAIADDIGAPVLLHGTSTGASVSLQVALDHPTVIRRLVLAAGAYRLGEQGRRFQADLAAAVERGENRAGWAAAMGMLAPGPLKYPARGAGWLAAPLLSVDDPTDMLITISAEDTFDVGDRLEQLSTPLLVLGGAADPFYSPDLFRRTAEGVADGRLVLFEGKGHLYVAANRVPAAVALGFLLAG